MLKQYYKMAINFNPSLFKTLLKYLKPKSKDKILDIGCSLGFYVKEMEKYAQETRGIDIDRGSLSKAVSQKVEYGDATDLKFKDNTFDKIYSLHTIEHIPEPNKFLSEISRVLKTDGTAVVVYPFEIIRGSQCLVSSCLMYKNPFMVQKIHLHRLTPKRLKKFSLGTSLKYIKSKLVFTFSPLSWQYLTVLKKV